MEQIKKRKINAVLTKGQKLKKISGFEDMDDESPQFSQQSSSLCTDNIVVLPDQLAEEGISSEQRELIVKTASWVFKNPDKAALLAATSSGNPLLHFMTERKSPSRTLYLKELERLRTEREVQSICAGVTPLQEVQQSIRLLQANMASGGHPALEATISATCGVTENVAVVSSNKPRKNRWGPTLVDADGAGAVASGSAEMHPSKIDTNNLHADKLADTSLERDRMARLVREQKELQLLESRIREAAALNMVSSSSAAAAGQSSRSIVTLPGSGEIPVSVCANEREAELHAERLRQYEKLAALDDNRAPRDTAEDADNSGGVIEGGTWEHRKRAKEMLATAGRSLELTAGAKGQHMSAYLPKEVLDAFLQRAKAIKTGETLLAVGDCEGEHGAHKLTAENNIGYQLLQKAGGWSEGSGLGATSSGITVPLQASSSNSNVLAAAGAVGGVMPGVEGGGLGVRATHELDAADDEFDSYRKRMMLAYKFRPNPLNNPRRNYY